MQNERMPYRSLNLRTKPPTKQVGDDATNTSRIVVALFGKVSMQVWLAAYRFS
jgi:hypothetical protein